jgi:uncharacterized protein YneF (UPF0154 family)
MQIFDLKGTLLIQAGLFIFVGVLIGVFIGGLAFKDNVKEIIQKEAIENQCGQYNPTTGNFEWIIR